MSVCANGIWVTSRVKKPAEFGLRTPIGRSFVTVRLAQPVNQSLNCVLAQTSYPVDWSVPKPG